MWLNALPIIAPNHEGANQPHAAIRQAITVPFAVARNPLLPFTDQAKDLTPRPEEVIIYRPVFLVRPAR